MKSQTILFKAELLLFTSVSQGTELTGHSAEVAAAGRGGGLTVTRGDFDCTGLYK